MDHSYTPDCPCPGCTMAWATSSPAAYADWLAQRTARSLAAAPAGLRTDLRHMGAQRTVHHRTQSPAAPAAPTRTSLDLVRHMVAVKRAEMRQEARAREFRGNPVLRREANEAARNFRDALATPIPNPYDKPAAARQAYDQLREAK